MKTKRKLVSYASLSILLSILLSACDISILNSSTTSSTDNSEEVSESSNFEDSSFNESSEDSSRGRKSHETSDDISSESQEDFSSEIISIESSEDISSEITSEESYTSSGEDSSNSYVADPMWIVDLSLRGEALRKALGDSIKRKKTKTTSYKGCLSIGASAAQYPEGRNTFVPFYHTTDTLTTQDKCNREHTWPDSRGGGAIETDPFVIRPTLTTDNSHRGNNFYGNSSSNEWDPASCGFEGARGESARVILYAATAYYDYGLELSNNPSDSTSLKTMGTLKSLIKWNSQYAPTAMEKQINDYLYEHGYGRNPFVDHPEYANLIWNEKGYATEETIGDTPDYSDYYNIETDLDNLRRHSFYICMSENTASDMLAMTGEPKSDSLPWYIPGVSIDTNYDKTKMYPLLKDAVKFDFDQNDDETFTIYNPKTKEYLCNYVDGTHYSIGFKTASNIPSNYSKNWKITKNGNGFDFMGTNNVYLEYYKGNFCGYKYKPPVPVYLYG